MMMEDLYRELQSIIQEETIYLRHYIGQVINVKDPLKKGRVKLSIPELGLISPELSIWCYPRQSSSMIIPKQNSWAEVYFINGDSTKPVYIYPASEIYDNNIKNYKGDVHTQVLFENPYNEKNNIKMNNGELVFFNGTEPIVKGSVLKTELQKNIAALNQLQIDFNNWVPIPNDGGASLKSILASGFLTRQLANLSNILSELIKII